MGNIESMAKISRLESISRIEDDYDHSFTSVIHCLRLSLYNYKEKL